MSLNYTPLRHKVLAQVGTGQMEYQPGWGHNGSEFVPKGGYSYRGQEKRVVTEINKAGLITYPGDFGFDRRPARLTAGGIDLLAFWTSQYGEPT